LEAAEAILSPPDQEASALDLLQLLCRKSLLRLHPPDGPGKARRFGFYESIHEFARRKLAASGEEPATLARHAAYYLAELRAVAEEAGRGEKAALDALALEQDNVRAILTRALANASGADISDALAALLILDPFLRLRGANAPHLALQTAVISAALALPE